MTKRFREWHAGVFEPIENELHDVGKCVAQEIHADFDVDWGNKCEPCGDSSGFSELRVVSVTGHQSQASNAFFRTKRTSLYRLLIAHLVVLYNATKEVYNGSGANDDEALRDHNNNLSELLKRARGWFEVQQKQITTTPTRD